MFRVNDVVVIRHDHPDQNVQAGQNGIVRMCYTVPDEAYEVEVVTSCGRPAAMLTLTSDQIEPYRPYI